jgi:hypothetical protein
MGEEGGRAGEMVQLARIRRCHPQLQRHGGQKKEREGGKEGEGGATGEAAATWMRGQCEKYRGSVVLFLGNAS